MRSSVECVERLEAAHELERGGVAAEPGVRGVDVDEREKSGDADDAGEQDEVLPETHGSLPSSLSWSWWAPIAFDLGRFLFADVADRVELFGEPPARGFGLLDACGELARDRGGLFDRLARGELLVDLLGLLVARADLGVEVLLARQLDAQLADDHLEAGGDRQREQGAEDAEQRAADEQGEQHDRGRHAERAAVDARDEDARLELLVEEHQGRDDQHRAVPCGATAKITGARGDVAADERDDVGEAGEHRERERVLDAEDP